MAVGEIASSGNATKSVKIAEDLDAQNSPPAAADAGIPVYPFKAILSTDGHCYTGCPAQRSTLVVKLGGTTPSVTLVLWGYLAAADEWIPMEVNGGAAVTSSYREVFDELGHFDQLYLEVATISGTDALVNAWLITSRTVNY